MSKIIAMGWWILEFMKSDTKYALTKGVLIRLVRPGCVVFTYQYMLCDKPIPSTYTPQFARKAGRFQVEIYQYDFDSESFNFIYLFILLLGFRNNWKVKK